MEAYLKSTGPARKVVQYRRGEVVFAQGDPGNDIGYLQKGSIKLSVLSRIGKEAVVAMLVPGDFFGEGALEIPESAGRHQARGLARRSLHGLRRSLVRFAAMKRPVVGSKWLPEGCWGLK